MNRQLGRLGEEFVVWFEKQRLLAAKRDDLAGKVDWVAETIGDGLGFDVLSFEEKDESDRLIEVKTTGMGKYAAFYVTAVELRCSQDMGDRFHLYRVFEFGAAPRMYTLRGSLDGKCLLEPTVYRARLLGPNAADQV